ncbi:DUF2780 domain-containing protein [Shewanella morhuae]|uniref:Protein of uncharacterized function VcgC/VcgE (DUF2780) n=1 Tax=Shewanella morhuae TaxID=365591 RepID=A0A380ATF9_9GAMM|nr:DUF2780 domain-containing protein [Shewanella morhuae]GIU13571.1 hypothetical protein TUM4641_33420 [Shewanella morhuae]SUI86134.1 Protein of uncharacterised function VcgC/VcgE (DUF2780) [Shewanella morhuae]
MKHTITLSILLGTCILAAPAGAGWLDNLTGAQAKTEKTLATATATQSNDLVGNVMSQLGLNQTQAEGGLGSLLGLAQSSLGTTDYSTLAASIPNADSLLAAAPALDSTSGVSGLLSKAGNLGSSLQSSAMVFDAFEKLGISKDLAMPMINIAKSYLDSNGAEGTSDLLTKGLSSLL